MTVPDEYLESSVRDYEAKIRQALLDLDYPKDEVDFYRSLIRDYAWTAVRDYQSVRRAVEQIVFVIENA